MNPANLSELKTQLDQALDFDQVLHQIAQFASFSASEEAILSALPVSDRLKAADLLALAREGMEIERLGIVVPLSGITDISRDVQEAAKKITLLPAQLNAVAAFLQGIKAVRRSMQLEQIPLLADLADSMDPLEKLAKSIGDKIDAAGAVRMDASPILKKLSMQLTETRLSLNNLSRQFLKANGSKLMQSMTTFVGGRMCVLVKAEHKYAFGGMIHGQSQSGQAVYAEPQSFVTLNNKIQEILDGIEEEKQAICRELSRQIASHEQTILSDLETMVEIDCALTKGRWACRFDGCIPVFHPGQSSLRLIHARHPLIDEKKVVANDYILKNGQNALVISGPNMGGKTVTLKTIGLAAALSHAGFPILAHEASLPWYSSLWFDIGDNQSIADNLSTFSAHMKKTARILREADAQSFVLLDEAGNGTDPAQGAALAIAVMETLAQQGTTLIASTHYNEVKAWGKSNEKILVSSVEFDPISLQPTYRYLPGISGASYAFAIAENFGIEKKVLERAASLQEENTSDLQRQIEQLEKQQDQLRKQQERFAALIADAHRVQKEAVQEKEKWQKKKESLETEYEEHLEAMLEEKEQEARKVIEALKQKDSIRQHEQNEALAALQDLLPETEPEEDIIDRQFKKGDYVKVEGLNFHGEILEVKKNKAVILANGKKTTLSLSKLSLMPKPGAAKPAKREYKEKVFTRFPMELNIIGMRVEEGIQALDSYLDQALYHHVKQVRIIHGMGTGRLRNAVWNDLKKQQCVKSFNAGGPSDGGLGATIVYLK